MKNGQRRHTKQKRMHKNNQRKQVFSGRPADDWQVLS